MEERLPLNERSFRALEDAYERQRGQARALQQQQSSSSASVDAAASRTRRLTRSAEVAAAEMQRLLCETRQLHRRFTQIVSAAEPPFTSAERERLAVLGFDVSRLPGASRQESDSSGEVFGLSAQLAQESSTAAKERSQVAALQRENAELLSALAWYRFQEKMRDAPQTSESARDSPLASPPCTAADVLTQLHGIQTVYKTLSKKYTATAGLCEASVPPVQSAVDVALEELFLQQQFPPQVQVHKLVGSPLYLLDRPVSIAFATPHSSRLVVQDPEGVEKAYDLVAYLTQLYKPLLHALHWQPPNDTRHAARSEGPVALSSTSPDVFVQPDTQSVTRKLNVDASVWTAQQGEAVQSFSDPQQALAPTAEERIPRRAPSVPQSALAELTYDELVALKRATLRSLSRDERSEFTL